MNARERFSLSIKGALFAALLLSLGFVNAVCAGDWNLKDRDGAHYTLSGLHGKWVLVNFWAPWCAYCIREMPDLIALQQQHQDLQIVGVAVMYGSRKEVTDAVGKHSLSYPIVFGSEDMAADFGGLDGMPTSFLYSPSGKLIKRYDGPLTKVEVEQVMAAK